MKKNNYKITVGMQTTVKAKDPTEARTKFWEKFYAYCNKKYDSPDDMLNDAMVIKKVK